MAGRVHDLGSQYVNCKIEELTNLSLSRIGLADTHER